ncbi:hypothetical protein LZ554_009474 [Drepanopeziza brunnea f. sp. 'monogermtubi']|nr:hypothetical protein LZ554_009474 [Drepanopeziza brunnea f. sp. 'monogermtubi']
MKFFNVVVLSLVGTSVAVPLQNVGRANKGAKAAAAASGAAAKSTQAASASNSGASNSGASNSGASNSGASNSGASNSGASNSGASNSGTSNSGASNTSNSGNSSSSASNTSNSGNSNSGNSNSGNTSGGAGFVGGTKPNADAVSYAAGAFANDAQTVSRSLNTLGSETDPETIRNVAATAFQAESDEDQRRNVLATMAGSAGAQSNSLIVMNTPAVLNGLMNIQNNPTPANAAANLPAIENARNPNILPSITQLSNAAMNNAGLPMMAVTFPATTGSTGPNSQLVNSNNGGEFIIVLLHCWSVGGVFEIVNFIQQILVLLLED